MDKKYIMFNDGRLGYIKEVCTCNQCKERGVAEVFIDDLDGKYMDCIKANEIENVVYVGDSLNDAVAGLMEYFKKQIEIKDFLINLYAEHQLFKCE